MSRSRPLRETEAVLAKGSSAWAEDTSWAGKIGVKILDLEITIVGKGQRGTKFVIE